MLKRLGGGLAAALALGALGALAATAQAAPANPTADLKASAADSSNVEKADYRRCWWRNGVKRCRWVDDNSYDPYGYGYGPYYGYGPGVNLYFGGRGHGGHRGGGHGGHGGGHRR